MWSAKTPMVESSHSAQHSTQTAVFTSSLIRRPPTTSQFRTANPWPPSGGVPAGDGAGDGQFVDMVTWQIHVHGVATRSGWRPCAKTRMSHRATPVPMHLREPLAAHMMSVGPDHLVFPAAEGGPRNDRNFAQRVFAPAIRAAGVRRGTPYNMRHTAASWLVQAGVPLKVQAARAREVRDDVALRAPRAGPVRCDLGGVGRGVARPSCRTSAARPLGRAVSALH